MECCQLSELVAIGGLVGGKRKPAKYYLDLYQVIQAEFPNNKIHLFGLGVTAAIFKEPKPFSIDFSTWTVPARFGNCVEVKDGVVHEYKLTPVLKDRARFSKDYQAELIRITIQALKTLEKGGMREH